MQAQPKGPTLIAMVRFGNVLGSCGSVVPPSRRQISYGGSITLTHPEITRFFMTIPEAAQLLPQAAVLAEVGDVLLLDMRQPVRTETIAEQMVRLRGLTIKDGDNPNGDIEIVCTGLRPSEKLYEELLIDAQSEPTSHPLIIRVREQSLCPELLKQQLTALQEAIIRHDVDTALGC